MLRGLGDRMPLDQYIFAAKFILWIASFRRISVRLHAVVKIENLRGVAERRVNFFFCPNVKRAFGVFPMAGVTAPGYSWAVGIFGGKKSAFLRSHITRDEFENIARDRFKLSILCDLEGIEIR